MSPAEDALLLEPLEAFHVEVRQRLSELPFTSCWLNQGTIERRRAYLRSLLTS